MAPQAPILRELEALLPPERLLTGPAARAAYASDALTAFRAEPLAVATPLHRDEVVAIVAACHRHGVPLVPRGSGTSLSGGSLPVVGGIVLALNRLDRVLELDPVCRTARVEPGAINLRISEAAAVHGLHYAPDPSSQSICTIGGNVAFNSGGAHCLKHGMTSNHVVGLVLVLPDGEVVELGGDSHETVGPDWLGLCVGHEGLFGVVVEVTVRLLPLPEAVSTVLAAYPSLEAAGAATTAIIAAGLLPVAIEIMDRDAIAAAEAAVGAGYPDVPALLLVELDGEAEPVAEESRRLERVLAASAPLSVRATTDPQERAAIWRGRKSAFSAVGWLSPDYLVQDGVVPRTRLAEALAEIDRLGERHGLRIANVFHAGDGNLHPLILFDGAQEGALERAEQLASEILRLCIRLGGSITGEHGVGVEKREHLAEMLAPADLALQLRIRRAVDPREICNRGKVFLPEAAA